MRWMLALLGYVLNDGVLMHKLAIAAGDPTCFRLTALIHAIPAGAMGAADRAALHEATERIGRGWNTQGVAGVAPQPFVIQMPAAPALPHPSAVVLEIQDRFVTATGKFDPAHRAVYAVIMTRTSAQLQIQGLRAVILAHPGHDFAILSDTEVRTLAFGGFLSEENLNVAAIDKLRRVLNPRLPAGHPTELAAYGLIAKWMEMFVNTRVGDLMIGFYTRVSDRMYEVAPAFCNDSTQNKLIRDFLSSYVIPIFGRAVANIDVYDAIAAAATTYLDGASLFSKLLSLKMLENEASQLSTGPRGHTGAPTGGLQRANNTAGGGTTNATAGSSPPRDPPPGRRRPAVYTDGPLPPFPQPPQPPNGPRIVLCYPSRSTFGRCPHPVCNKQHDWTGITAADQAPIKTWLVQWLRKTMWEQYIKWSDNNGTAATWPAICC